MLKHRIKWYFRAGVTAALMAFFSATHAAPLVSIKAAGMGGGSAAYGMDSLTPFLNPATATQVWCRADLGLSTRYESRQVTLGDRTAGLQTGEIRPIRNWDFYGYGGFNTRAGWCGEWAFNVQWNNYDHIHNHYGRNLVDFSGGTPTAPTGTPMQFNYRVEALTTTVAYDIGWGQTLGVAANCYFQWLNIAGFEAIVGEGISEYPTYVTNKATDYSHGVGITVGWTGNFLWNDCLTLGFAYTPRTSMTEFRKYKGFLATHTFDIPATIRGAAAIHFNPCTTLAADVEFRRYSRVRSWSNKFPFSSAGGITTFFGTDYGPGFGWQDQWIGKLGFEYQFLPCLTGRLGYRYEKSPIRTTHGGETTALNVATIDVVQNFVSAGFTYCINPAMDFSMFGEYGVINRIHGKFPTIDAQFSAANVTYQAYTVSLGLAYGWNY